jgi:hypothetical protein
MQAKQEDSCSGAACLLGEAYGEGWVGVCQHQVNRLIWHGVSVGRAGRQRLHYDPTKNVWLVAGVDMHERQLQRQCVVGCWAGAWLVSL